MRSDAVPRIVLRGAVLAFGLLFCAACSPTKPGGPEGSSFENAGASLRYVIDRPTGAGPFPGIVLVHEGGPVTKEALASLGASLRNCGYMVLRYDKRGIGQSTGTFEEVSVGNSIRVLGTLASDAVAAVQTLLQQPGVNPARVGLVGASQAGWVMPLAASQSPSIRFFAAVVGPTVSVGFVYRYFELAQNSGLTIDQLSQQMAGFTGEPGFAPRPLLQSLSIPALWMLAADDRTVPSRESAAIIEELIASGKPYRVTQYPGGHEIRTSDVYLPVLYAWLDPPLLLSSILFPPSAVAQQFPGSLARR